MHSIEKALGSLAVFRPQALFRMNLTLTPHMTKEYRIITLRSGFGCDSKTIVTHSCQFIHFPILELILHIASVFLTVRR